MKKDSTDLTTLKGNIGFGTAFKATLGFYAAQFVATILGLFTFAFIICVVVLLVKLFN